MTLLIFYFVFPYTVKSPMVIQVVPSFKFMDRLLCNLIAMVLQTCSNLFSYEVRILRNRKVLVSEMYLIPIRIIFTLSPGYGISLRVVFFYLLFTLLTTCFPYTICTTKKLFAHSIASFHHPGFGIVYTVAVFAPF
jgi:hypothetical protein